MKNQKMRHLSMIVSRRVFFSFQMKKNSKFFIWAKKISSVSKIFPGNFQIFSEILQNPKEKSLWRRKMSKFFACGGLETCFNHQFWIKTSPNWLKSRPKGAKIFWGEKVFISPKQIKKHWIQLCTSVRLTALSKRRNQCGWRWKSAGIKESHFC